MTKKFNVIVADPPWQFSDKLTMSDVARGAEANYNTLDIEELKKLPVDKLSADNAILCLWVPSSLLQDGLDVLNSWGFYQTQTFIWIKTQKNPFSKIISSFKDIIKSIPKDSVSILKETAKFKIELSKFDFNNLLAFYMGRLFRQCHEIVIIGVKGKIYSNLKNKSQRSVMFGFNVKHSAKPEELQDRLELMFPHKDGNEYLELFARRERKNWLCLGNEAPSSLKEDIRESLKKLL